MSLFKERQAPDAHTLTGYPVPDLETLRLLVDHGANLGEQRHVLHYLYVNTADQQSEAARIVREAGWETSTPEPLPAYPGQWLVLAERPDATLTPEFVQQTRGFFEETAALFDGDYDGWEASV